MGKHVCKKHLIFALVIREKIIISLFFRLDKDLVK